MGKTKITVIDDSAPEEPKVKRKKVNPSPEELEAEKKAKLAVISNDLSEKSQDSNQIAASGRSLDPPRNDNDESRETKQEGKKAQKPGKRTKVRSKKYMQSQEKVERTKAYPLNEAVEMAKASSYSKFDGTVELHLNTLVKGIRGLITLPFSAGKSLKVLAFGSGAKESGADLVGDEATLDEIAKGKVDFDVLITTPDWMPKLARVAKVLGPRGLMPNPKSGTITTDLKKAVSELQGGKTEYKSEAKANIIHLGAGKVSQDSSEIAQNIKLLLTTIGKTRIKKATLSPTMGAGVRLDLSSI